MSASEEIPVGTGADDDSLPSDGSNNCAKRIKLDSEIAVGGGEDSQGSQDQELDFSALIGETDGVTIAEAAAGIGSGSNSTTNNDQSTIHNECNATIHQLQTENAHLKNLLVEITMELEDSRERIGHLQEVLNSTLDNNEQNNHLVNSPPAASS